MYKVVKPFIDLQDNGYRYVVGDKYPRNNGKINRERVEILLSPNNALGYAVIEEIKENNDLHLEEIPNEVIDLPEEEIKEEKPKKKTRKKK